MGVFGSCIYLEAVCIWKTLTSSLWPECKILWQFEIKRLEGRQSLNYEEFYIS